MLSTIEKTIALKTVEIFADAPDNISTKLGALLQEIELPQGETIFEKGDLGDCMYIIVSGRVRVHDDHHTLNYMSEGDVFGEMAVLDPEPRVASVTATEDTLLLRLDQGAFYELMEDHIKVTRGIIRLLVSQLRDRDREITEVKARLAGI
jgi:CRP-like cAMP-binding protein